MHEIFRWPSFVEANHGTAKLEGGNVYYRSWSPPQPVPPQFVNCIMVPAVARRILAVRMMIAKRGGATTNPCRFLLRIIDANTGITINQLPTTPPALVPMNVLLFPIMTWQTVYQAIPASTAPIVNTNEYLGVVFAGSAGVMTTSNDFEVWPLFEVELHS